MGEITKQYITVKLNNDLYGIDIKYIHNIITMQRITRIPKSQVYYKGVINLRGEVIPVLDLRNKFGIEEGERHSKNRIIIVKPDPQAASIGMIVDEVKEVISLSNEEIEIVNFDEAGKHDNYSIGIGKAGEDLVNILNIPEIIIEKETA